MAARVAFFDSIILNDSQAIIALFCVSGLSQSGSLSSLREARQSHGGSPLGVLTMLRLQSRSKQIKADQKQGESDGGGGGTTL